MDLNSDQPIKGELYQSNGGNQYKSGTLRDFHFGEIPDFGVMYFMSGMKVPPCFCLLSLLISNLVLCGFFSALWLIVVYSFFALICCGIYAKKVVVFQLAWCGVVLPVYLLNKFVVSKYVWGSNENLPLHYVIIFTALALGCVIYGFGLYKIDTWREKVGVCVRRQRGEQGLDRRDETNAAGNDSDAILSPAAYPAPVIVQTSSAAAAAVSSPQFNSLLEALRDCSSVKEAMVHLQFIAAHAADSRMHEGDKQALLNVSKDVHSKKVDLWTPEVAQAFGAAIKEVNISMERSAV